MDASIRVRGVLGGVAAKRMEVPMTPDMLASLGKCMVDSFSKEAKKDFAKRGWTGEAQDGSAPIWDSFSYKIRGEKTIEVVSTFPFIDQLVGGDTEPYKMTWLTQEEKERKPSKFPLTPTEKRLGLKRGGRVSDGGRLPLVVPLKDDNGTTIFRMAPLTFADAWVHPGIARFTFVQRAAKQGREKCLQLIKQEVLATVVRKLSE